MPETVATSVIPPQQTAARMGCHPLRRLLGGDATGGNGLRHAISAAATSRRANRPPIVTCSAVVH